MGPLCAQAQRAVTEHILQCLGGVECLCAVVSAITLKLISENKAAVNEVTADQSKLRNEELHLTKLRRLNQG